MKTQLAGGNLHWASIFKSMQESEGALCVYWIPTKPDIWVELVESTMNHYLAPMPCYWISMNIVMLNVQVQCFINVLTMF